MERPRAALVLLLLFFIFFAPDNQPRRRFPIDTQQFDLARQRDFDVLLNSSYGDLSPQNGRWLNLTGFRRQDGYAWNLLSTAQHLSREQLQKARNGLRPDDVLPMYEEISGEIRGKFLRSDISENTFPHINLTTLDPKREYFVTSFQRNVTEADGDISFSLYDSEPNTETREIKAEISIATDSSPGNGWQTTLRGVHLPYGGVVLSTSSSKYDAFPALPQFVLQEAMFNNSRPAMNNTVKEMWKKKEDDVFDGLLSPPNCELIVWLQPKPVLEGMSVHQSSAYLRLVEQEMRYPEGAPIGTPPPLTFSAIVFSPDCGYILEAETIFGPKVEAYWGLAERLLVALIVVLGLQITLLKRQMEKAATPSTRSRISYQTIGIAALGDGMLLFALVALTMLDQAAFLVASAAAFLGCIHVAFLEVKFVFDIWTVQVGDPARAEAERQRRATPPSVPSPAPPAAIDPNVVPAPNTAPAPATTTSTRPSRPSGALVTSADGIVGLPLPVTAPRIRIDGATPVILPPDQDIDAAAQVDIPSARVSFASIYGRFYFALVCLTFFSLWAISWPRTIRSVFANILIFCYLSFWLPQIYRNAMRNCRKALSWEYVIGSSILRTIPILYWYFAERNILSIDTSPGSAFFFLAWIWFQVLLLASQQQLGPRLLVRDSWCPPAYDYHPVLQEDDLEAGGMPIGQLASASEAKDKDDKTRKVFDCAICMNEIDVPIVSKQEGAGRGSTWLEQKNYMVTPCRHIFHAECLEGWMNLRLVLSCM